MLALIAVLASSGVAGAGTGGTPPAQTNLETARTAALTYYTENTQSFTGLDPTTFATLDTGLTAVDGFTASTKPHVISLLSQNSFVILAAWGSGHCWAIIDIADSTILEGFTGPGTIYMTSPDVTEPSCSAATFDSATPIPGVVVSTTGFPPTKVPPPPRNAQTNLGTARTAALTYYMENIQSFTGLDPTTFATLDTGLTAVDGSTASTKPYVISLLSQNSFVILAAWGSRHCWAIIDIADSTTLEGFTGPGTIYMTSPEVKKASCSAASFDSATPISGVIVSTTGFPSP